MGDIQTTAAKNLIAAKKRSKRYYDLKANPKSFREGDTVYLLKEPRISKFNAYYTGPYILEQIMGESNAQIRIKANKIKIVHLDKLKLAALPVTLDEEPQKDDQ